MAQKLQAYVYFFSQLLLLIVVIVVTAFFIYREEAAVIRIVLLCVLGAYVFYRLIDRGKKLLKIIRNGNKNNTDY